MVSHFIAFYLGGAFYVGALAAGGHADTNGDDEPLSFTEVLMTAAMWPYSLFQILRGG